MATCSSGTVGSTKKPYRIIIQRMFRRTKLKKIKKTKKQKDALPLQDQVSDFLFQISRDQPDILGEGHAETHLTILAPRLRQMAVADAARALEEYAQKLERLDKFTRKYLKKKAGRIVEEIATSFESIDFITDGEVKKWGDEYFWDDECRYVELAKKRLGCEIQVRVHFDGADTLKQVVERIDKAVASIKPELDHLYRFGKPLWPSILNLHTLSRELSVL